MANTEKGEFDLTFGATTLTFKVGTSALIACQESLARPDGTVPTVDEIMVGVIGGRRVAYARAFLWAGLRKYHPQYTPEMVSDLIDEASREQMQALIVKLGGSVTPDPKDAEALGMTDAGKKRGKRRNPPEAQTPGTGAGSTSRPDAVV